MTDVDPTRRAFLLAAGTSIGLVGAFAADGGPDVPDVSYDRGALREVARLGVPSVPTVGVVPVAPAHLAMHRDRAESLLESAPADLGVPNEAVAREYARRREDAVESLVEADRAATPVATLDDLRWARHRAADAATVAAAVDGNRSREWVRDRRATVRADLRAFRDRWRYVGDDPAGALAVHAELESLAGHADTMLDQAADLRETDGSPSLRLGSRASDVELARALVTDAAYTYDRHRDALEDARPLRDAFDRALAVLAADVTARCPARPDEGFDSRVDREPRASAGRPLLREALSEARRRCRRVGDGSVREDAGVATALVAAGAADRDRRALEQVSAAVSGGAYGVSRSAARPRREKLTALEAVATARDAAPTPLSAGWVRTAARYVDWGDDARVDTLERDRPLVSAVAEAVAEYAWGRAVAAATPDALSRLVGVVDAAAAPADRASVSRLRA